MRLIFSIALLALACLGISPSMAQSRVTDIWLSCAVTDAKGASIVYGFAIDLNQNDTLRELRINRNGSILIHSDTARPSWSTAEIGNYYTVTYNADPRYKIVMPHRLTTRMSENMVSGPAILMRGGDAIAKGACVMKEAKPA